MASDYHALPSIAAVADLDVPRTSNVIDHRFPENLDERLVAFSHFWLEEAREQIFHHDNRKYQFIYLAGLSIASLVLAIVSLAKSGADGSNVAVVSLSGVGVMLAVPAAILLQKYTSSRNELRNQLLTANYCALTGSLDAKKWGEATRDAYHAFINSHNQLRKKHKLMFRLLDKLT